MNQLVKEYGKEYSVQNLKYMSRLARVFKIDEISQQLVGQISMVNFSENIV